MALTQTEQKLLSKIDKLFSADKDRALCSKDSHEERGLISRKSKPVNMVEIHLLTRTGALVENRTLCQPDRKFIKTVQISSILIALPH